MNEPPKIPAPPVAATVPSEPPPSDDEFVGTRSNNPFLKGAVKNNSRIPSIPSNPFKNRFEPEG